MTKLNVHVSGEEVSGKSTALVLMAQELAKLGYDVVVPKHLVGLNVVTHMLRADQCQSTTITFSEQNDTSYHEWAVNFTDNVRLHEGILHERNRLEELSRDCAKRIEALADAVATRCPIAIGDIVEVNYEQSARHWFVVQRIFGNRQNLMWIVTGMKCTKAGRITGGIRRADQRDFNAKRATLVSKSVKAA